MKRISIIVPLEGPGKYDFISGFFVNPPYGILPVATRLKKHGYEVKVFAEIISKDIDWDYVFLSDYIAFCTMTTFSAPKAYRYAKKIRAKSKVPIIWGGVHASILPEECLEHCDYVVRGEGEDTIVELLDAIEENRDVSAIKNLSFKTADGKMIHNPYREFMKDFDDKVDTSLIHGYGPLSKNVDPMEAFVRHGRVHLQPIQASRGCPYNCRFCMCPREFGRTYRTRDIDTIIAEIDDGLTRLKNNVFIFVDNDFALDRKRTKVLMSRIIERFGRDTLNLVGFTRPEVGEDPELMELMRDAGFKVLVLGIESTSDAVLQELDKKQTAARIEKNIDAIHSCGLGIWAAMVVGADADTIDTVRDSVDFLLKKNFFLLGFNSLTPAIYQTKVFGIPQHFPDNRYIHNDWRFFTGAFVNHFPKNIRPSTLQREIKNGYSKFYSFSKNRKELSTYLTPLFMLARLLRFYPSAIMAWQKLIRPIDAYGGIARRVYTMKPLFKAMDNYLPFLEKAEEGLYDGERLIEERLPPVDNLDLMKRLPID
ncbi:MAG: B12-binding domain-containing radical SAM protein [Spirochaetes bacterium]|nr:B12-binding domain-containing radical SAM protein [Spirochaetota bacterium]